MCQHFTPLQLPSCADGCSVPTLLPALSPGDALGGTARLGAGALALKDRGLCKALEILSVLPLQLCCDATGVVTLPYEHCWKHSRKALPLLCLISGIPHSDFLASFQGNETTRAAAAHSQGACAGDGNPTQLCSQGWRCKVSVADGHHSHHYTPNQTLCGVAEGVLQPMVVSPP